MVRVNYLSFFTFRSRVHLAVVFCEVVIERCFTVAHSHHSAVVRAVVPVVAEELSTVYVSAK